MAKENTLKLEIGNRTYPLKVQQSEEALILEAVKLIAEKIKEYESSYAVRDQQDLIAMSCLHFATQFVTERNQTDKIQHSLSDSILQWNAKIDALLK